MEIEVDEFQIYFVERIYINFLINWISKMRERKKSWIIITDNIFKPLTPGQVLF